ncbi:O-succinylhomoserine sulfhydrylase [uncultured Serinicoccus sp.]|uniref:O-succinylhomoserine sulfhydrylase n=1 Tax=uncultured Serinicoccus sp. TaxID=735514 RepID=UPI00261AD0D4|nr:O-succinylhomoserine sulfhydrylase [uncultured Serinicoccus sp.]
MDTPDGWRPDTLAVRGGLLRSPFDETSEALYPTSGYVYGSAEEAQAAFNDEIERFVYSRYGNPTVAMLEERMRLLHGAEAAQATASGMSAVFTALGGLCAAGDRIVASRSLFGSCFVIIDEVLRRWGVESTFVDGTDLDDWARALETPAAAVFFETPSNPTQELVDITAVSELAHAAGAVVVVDNVFGTPVFSRPLDHGADIVVYSTTKHIDGQGRVMGGMILGPTALVGGPIQTLLRHTGPAMSPFNAWVTLKGLETLTLRVERQAAGALELARHLEGDPRVARVFHPWLESHPQAGLARRQMTGGGTVVTFTLDGGQQEAFAFMNALQIVDISNNLGDAKSLTTHPATTTHKRLPEPARVAAGITGGTVRLSVGLEDVEDLREDLERGLVAAFG